MRSASPSRTGGHAATALLTCTRPRTGLSPRMVWARTRAPRRRIVGETEIIASDVDETRIGLHEEIPLQPFHDLRLTEVIRGILAAPFHEVRIAGILARILAGLVHLLRVSRSGRFRLFEQLYHVTFWIFQEYILATLRRDGLPHEFSEPQALHLRYCAVNAGDSEAYVIPSQG